MNRNRYIDDAPLSRPVSGAILFAASLVGWTIVIRGGIALGHFIRAVIG